MLEPVVEVIVLPLVNVLLPDGASHAVSPFAGALLRVMVFPANTLLMLFASTVFSSLGEDIISLLVSGPT